MKHRLQQRAGAIFSCDFKKEEIDVNRIENNELRESSLIRSATG